MRKEPIAKEKQDFIVKNFNLLTQKEIARELKVTPQCVNNYVKGIRGNIYRRFLKKYE